MARYKGISDRLRYCADMIDMLDSAVDIFLDADTYADRRRHEDMIIGMENEIREVGRYIGYAYSLIDCPQESAEFEYQCTKDMRRADPDTAYAMFVNMCERAKTGHVSGMELLCAKKCIYQIACLDPECALDMIRGAEIEFNEAIAVSDSLRRFKHIDKKAKARTRKKKP